MKKVLIVLPHSVVDVITNSSSELFVCGVDMTVETVKEAIEEVIALYNKQTGNSYEYCQIFEEPRVLDNGEVYIRNTYENSVPYIIARWVEDVFDA